MKIECRAAPRGVVPEWSLPACVREALEAARRSRPHTDITCVAFRTLSDGREIAHIEPDAGRGSAGSVNSILGRLYARDLLVLSVTVTETTFEAVATATHVLVALTSPRDSAC